MNMNSYRTKKKAKETEEMGALSCLFNDAVSIETV
jgi:hypothetical protein